jgi:hypothetical protein
MRCDSVSLSAVLMFRNQLCNLAAILLYSWVFPVFVYWGLVSLPWLLFLEQGQWFFYRPPAVNMLWWFAVYFSILLCHLTFNVVHWLRRWALWTATCPISGSLITHPLSALLVFQCLLIESLSGDLLLALSSFSGVLLASRPLCCVLVFSSVFIRLFFFFQELDGQSAQGSMLVYPRGGWRNTAWSLLLTCLVCQMSSKQVWSQCLAAAGAFLFSQCNEAWKSFLRARGSGC